MLQSLLLLCLASLGVAVPVEDARKVKAASPPLTDTDILNYALTLEYLERRFYTEGLKNFTSDDFIDAGFDGKLYDNLARVRDDEKSHVKFLSTALGSAAIAEPRFTFPVQNAHDFVGLAGVLEGVGVSAYLGAAASVSSKDYLTAAGSILTVEARHASYLRSVLHQVPAPTSYDTPLGFNQVFSLAAGFTTFPPGTKVPFKAFPPLAASSFHRDGKFCSGQSFVTFKNINNPRNSKIFAVLYSGQQTYYVPATPTGPTTYRIRMPGDNFAYAGEPAPAGQVYAILSTADGKGSKASDDNTLAGVAILEVSRC
ncbi:ferritin-like protein [Ophiocordyceps camponoti-floridani]|uniref:Ferritin-like protein n=1 Tax=Ophiocordyceps camponoti-floridani TaxID=2030778 RepID=A0A8H4QBX7_9HYPO|nr:ferritin-like protein [Ophiocordyceps camponoti-floridani]